MLEEREWNVRGRDDDDGEEVRAERTEVSPSERRRMFDPAFSFPVLFEVVD